MLRYRQALPSFHQPAHHRLAPELIHQESVLIYDTQFASDDDFETYLNDMKNQSSYTIPDAWPSKTDHIVSLSTCVAAHGSTRMIIQGKLVNITDYSGDDIPLTSLTTQNQNSNDTPDSSEQQ